MKQERGCWGRRGSWLGAVGVVVVAFAACEPESEPERRLQRGKTALERAAVHPDINTVTNGGGPVISNVIVYEVNWGTSVSTVVTSAMPAFFTALVYSPFMDLLTQYTTSTQPIGRGTFGGQFTITPSVTTTAITDAQIQTELANQIASGALPKSQTDANGNVNSFYEFFFPPGDKITVTFGGSTVTSCDYFCEYNNATTIGTQLVPYGVIPDMGSTSACSNSCDGTTELSSITASSSHALADAVTDANPNAPHQAWIGPSGQIADECFSSGTVTGIPDPVATVWSNAAAECTDSASVGICAFGSKPPACRYCVAQDSGDSACALINARTPLCSTSAADAKYGTCVQCGSNADCSGATPVCLSANDNSDDTCVQCSATSHAACAGSTPACINNACAACTADSQCGGAVCALSGDSHAGQCVQCTASDHGACTGAMPNCSPTTDTCVGCTSNANCPGSTPICDPTSNACRGCGASSECPTGVVCATATSDSHLGQCVQCTTTAECSAGLTCSASTDSCVGCISNAQCGNPEPVCSAGACTACTTDAQCAAGAGGSACETQGSLTGCVECTTTNKTACTGATALCDPGSDKCVACELDSQCTGSAPICDATNHSCRACSGAADCPGKVCVTAANDAHVGTCVQCAEGSACMNGQTCDPTSDTCVSCASNGDCANPTPICTASGCAACQSDQQCGGNSCIGGSCFGDAGALIDAGSPDAAAPSADAGEDAQTASTDAGGDADGGVGMNGEVPEPGPGLWCGVGRGANKPSLSGLAPFAAWFVLVARRRRRGDRANRARRAT